MFSSSDKSSKGYSHPEEEPSKRSLNDLSSSLRDVEVPFKSAGQPSGAQRLKRELQQNWWLWGSVAFAVILIGSLVIFRNSLYTKTGYGLPFLAVKENAAEACATQCKDEASALQSGKEKLDEAKLREMYDECYTKCVAEETKEVAEERESFKKEEEQFEKEIEAKEQKKGGVEAVVDTAKDGAKTAVDTAKDGAKTAVDTAKGAATAAVDTAKGAATAAVDTAKGAATAAVDTAKGAATAAVDTAKKGTTSAADAAKKGGSSAADVAKGSASTITDKVTQAASAAP